MKTKWIYDNFGVAVKSFEVNTPSSENHIIYGSNNNEFFSFPREVNLEFKKKSEKIKNLSRRLHELFDYRGLFNLSSIGIGAFILYDSKEKTISREPCLNLRLVNFLGNSLLDDYKRHVVSLFNEDEKDVPIQVDFIGRIVPAFI